jgi:ubiquinone/menaquinone biosynthesis C-methylase UbiE
MGGSEQRSEVLLSSFIPETACLELTTPMELRLLHKFIARQLAHPSGLFGRWFTARWLDKANAAMNKLTLERLSVAAGDRLLEVGFGGGDLLEQLLSTKPIAFVAGVDLSMEMVNVVGRRLSSYILAGKADVRTGDIEALPYADGEFNKLCSVNTLYFWRNPSVALAECRRVLRRGGQIILCFNAKQDLALWLPHKHGFRLYDLSEVEDLLDVAGFTSIEVVSAKDSEQGEFYCVTGNVA